ncbi:hypothetical protein OTU49_010682, partial [Cherax quadricarinatus]
PSTIQLYSRLQESHHHSVMSDNSKGKPVGRTPHTLVTEESVKGALLADKGSDAHLVSWKFEDFTTQGDNYASIVSSVKVMFSLEGQDSEVAYVVKLNPCRNFESLKGMTGMLFEKEVNFYLSLLPHLNAALTTAGQEPLRVPRCFYGSLERGKEFIFLEDLRPRGFKMFDRRKGLDVAHTSLVVKELARFHASSVLLEATTPDEDLVVQHDFLIRDWTDFDVISTMFDSYLKNAIDMLGKVGGYERSISWVESLRLNIREIILEQLERNGKYSVVCHGDCWNNNVLFRYDEDGTPIEVMLLDLQVVRKCSPTTDLNYLLFTSLTGEVRKPNLDTFLDTYYSSFLSVMESADMDMPFTDTFIKQEFQRKNVFGALFAMMLVPIVLFEPEDVPDFSSGTDENIDEFMNNFRTKGLEMLDTNPHFKSRYLSIFDELMELGLIP